MWLYYDESSKKSIVVKKFQSSFQEAFRTERRILEKLRHSTLCPPVISCDEASLVI